MTRPAITNPGTTEDIARAQRIFARVYAAHAKSTNGRVRAKYERRAAEATKRAEAAAAGGEVL